MTEWSEESIRKAELELAAAYGTWHEKIRAALDAAITQRDLEEQEMRRYRLEEKIKELKGL